MKIARDWNVTASGSRYVTRFSVQRAFLGDCEVQNAGGSEYQEYWIPAEHLARLNENIVGQIEVIAEFHSKQTP